jgi:hypothetical protein
MNGMHGMLCCLMMMVTLGLAGPSMEIRNWKNEVIPNGQMITSFENGTDFGSTNAPMSSEEQQQLQRTFTVINSGDESMMLGMVPVHVAGSGFSLVTMPGPMSVLAPSASTTVIIRPNPSEAGLYIAQVGHIHLLFIFCVLGRCSYAMLFMCIYD